MIVAALALAGIFISLYLTLYKLGIIGELSCSIGSCETVNTSKYSRFLGLPVAAWGLLFYLDVFAIALIGTFERFENDRSFRWCCLPNQPSAYSSRPGLLIWSWR